MNRVDEEYNRLITTVLTNGKLKHNRTGIDTIGVFGEQSKYKVSLSEFPILTTKRIYFRAIVHELLWFIKGDTNIKYLVDNDVHIWDEWAYAKYKKSGVYTDDECWNQDRQGIECYDQKTFIDRIKSDTEFANKWGELGEGTYGGMWRAFPYYYDVPDCEYGSLTGTVSGVEGKVDQLQKVIDKLKTNPDDRRMIVSAWHPYWVDRCALPPCHCLYHFNTEELSDSERFSLLWDKCGFLNGENSYGKDDLHFLEEYNIPKRRLNCLLYQRSNDVGLGIPFNITSYALLTALVAHCVGMVPGTFTHSHGDLHIYTNHIDQLKLQLKNEPKDLPKLWLNPEVKSLFDFKYEDIKLENYQSHSTIKMNIAV